MVVPVASGVLRRMEGRVTNLPGREALGRLGGQFALFLVAGGIATAAHYSLLIILVTFSGADAVWASVAGYGLGALVGYILNYRFTFKSTRRHREALTRFLTVAVIGLGLNAGVMKVAVDVVGLHYLIAQILATGLVLVWNFVANKLWSF